MKQDKPVYGPRKTKSDYSDREIDEVFYNQEPSAISKWGEAFRLLIILMVKLLNPFNWKRILQVSYYAWLKRNNKYDKLLDIWSAKRPKTPAGEVIRSLKITDCHIQLGNYTEGMHTLKGLADKIDEADRDDEWKEEHYHLVKFYRTTIHDLAKIPVQRKPR